MNGQELLEWLSAIPETERRNSNCLVEILGNTAPLITAKYYQERTLYNEQDKPMIYLIYK